MSRTRGPQPRDPEPFWMPVRFVPDGVTCDFCRFVIPRSFPGRRTGERGTKAYFNSLMRVYECIGCRQDELRAQSARLDAELAARAAATTAEAA